MQDKEIAKAFVAARWGDADKEIRIRFVGERREDKLPCRDAFGSIDNLWSEIVRMQTTARYAVYYFTNEMKPGPGSGWKGCAEDADAVSGDALVADFDAGVPELWEEKYIIPPSIIVHTSAKDGAQRGQAIWLVSDLTMAEFEPAQKRLAHNYGTDTQIINPSRVLRLPGTLHQKREPSLVTFEATGAPRHTVAELMAGLKAAPAEEPRRPASPATGNPVPREKLVETLGWLKEPWGDRGPWRDTIAAIRNTPIEGDDDESWRREIADKFSQGLLYREKRDAPKDYDPEAVEHVFDTMPPKVGGASYGKIAYLAKAAGWANGQTSSEEAFAHFQGPKKREEESFRVYSLAEVRSWKAPTMLVKRFLQTASHTAISGKPKTGKSFIALDTCLSIAAGVPVFGVLEALACGPTVYVTNEGITGFNARIAAWCKIRKLTEEQQHRLERNFKFVRQMPFAKNEGEEYPRRHSTMIAAAIRAVTPKPLLVALDTMARAMSGLDENQAKEAGLFIDMTDRIREELGCAMLTVAHIGKTPGQGIRGSNAVEGGLDSVWQTDENKETKTVLLDMKLAKDLDEEQCPPLCFRLDGVPLEINGTTHRSAALRLVAMREHKPGNDKTPDDLSKAGVRIKKRAELGENMRRIGMREGEFMPIKVLAEALAGTKQPDDKPGDWETRHALIYDDLDKGSAANYGGKDGPIYQGYVSMRAFAGGTQLLRHFHLPLGRDGEAAF